jgi:hypothetical protein
VRPSIPLGVTTVGGSEVRILGSQFTIETTIKIGTSPLTRPALLSSNEIMGWAPGSRLPGTADVTAMDSRGTTVPSNVLRYVAPDFGVGQFVRGEYKSRGVVDLSDSLFLPSYLFLGGPAMPAPFPEPGLDPTPDSMSCEPTSAQALEVTPTRATLSGVGSTLERTVKANRDGIVKDVRLFSDGTTYPSSNPAVALVYRNGLFEAKTEGSVTIRVANGQDQTQLLLTVVPSMEAPRLKVLGWSEYGSSSIDHSFSVLPLHPPGPTLRAQVLKADADGKVTLLDPTRIDLRFAPIADARGSENLTSANKTDFWKQATIGYSVHRESWQGLFGLFMPEEGPAPGPQSFARDAQ